MMDRTWIRALCALSAALLAGCSGGSGTGCIVGTKFYQAGQTFPATDGCNTCTCEPTGDVACTLLACGPPDGVMCTGATQAFPIFNKTCAMATDCAIAMHQTDCCGSLSAIGITTSEQARFNKDEAACRAMYPGCGCAPRPTLAEDGKTSTALGGIGVACTASACTTYVK